MCADMNGPTCAREHSTVSQLFCVSFLFPYKRFGIRVPEPLWVWVPEPFRVLGPKPIKVLGSGFNVTPRDKEVFTLFISVLRSLQPSARLAGRALQEVVTGWSVTPPC